MMHFALDFVDGKRIFQSANTDDWESACDFMLDMRDKLRAIDYHGPCSTQDELTEYIYCAENDC